MLLQRIGAIKSREKRSIEAYDEERYSQRVRRGTVIPYEYKKIKGKTSKVVTMVSHMSLSWCIKKSITMP